MPEDKTLHNHICENLKYYNCGSNFMPNEIIFMHGEPVRIRGQTITCISIHYPEFHYERLNKTKGSWVLQPILQQCASQIHVRGFTA
jgi:hypothetical protein